MDNSKPTMAEQVARAARDFDQQRTGHAPKAVTVVLSGDTLVVTLHEALSPAERALVRSSAGAAQVREFHSELFQNSVGALRQEIERITGVAVRESAAEVETTTGAVVQVFTSGTMVQVFQLAGDLPAETWNGRGPDSGEFDDTPIRLHEEQPEGTGYGRVSASSGLDSSMSAERNGMRRSLQHSQPRKRPSMLTNKRRTPGGKAAVIYVTVGALIDVWSGIWGFYLLNNPGHGTAAWYWCYGLLLTGAALVLIGMAIGWIGRSRPVRRHAGPPHEDVSSAATANELPVAARSPVPIEGNLTAAPGIALRRATQSEIDDESMF